MTRLELLTIGLQFLVIELTALGIGLTVIKLSLAIALRKRPQPDQDYSVLSASVASLVGLGSLGYLWLIAGLFGQFTKTNLEIIGLTSLMISMKELRSCVINWTNRVQTAWRGLLQDPFSLAVLVATIAVLWGVYLAAMQLPYASDELHYHFPEAQLIIANQRISWTLGSHYFYGNIPKLMEVIFAGGIALSGYALAHALHVAFLLGFLGLVGGLLTRHYHLKTALVACLFIVLYDDFTWNASVGFVDAATVSLEIGALFLAIDWFVLHNRRSLIVSAILIGLAMSVKYSPAITLLFIAILVMAGVLLDQKRSLKLVIETVVPFSLVTILFGGYWYIKNAILFANPFYPLYFGHRGVSELQYQGLVNAIQAFGPKTWQSFRHIPRRYLTVNSLVTYISFYLAPLTVLVKRARRFHYVLLLYYVLYVPYWFFLATHQHRFLMPGIIAALVLTAIALTQLQRSLQILVFTTVVTSLVALNRAQPFYNKTSLKNFVETKLRLNERQYALGKVSKSEFLNGQFGCQYAIIETLQLKGWNGNVIDNWSVWHAPSVSFYTTKNRFTGLSFDPNDSTFELIGLLRSQGIRFIYYDENVKADFLRDPDQEVINYRTGRDKAEDYLLHYSTIAYENGVCKLYEIDFSKLTIARNAVKN